MRVVGPASRGAPRRVVVRLSAVAATESVVRRARRTPCTPRPFWYTFASPASYETFQTPYVSTLSAP
ncbi:hypothetical protein SGM_2474 [Streptomyces griseoaurantiacus M045]|uniref:Uncharacterized protein n=1 Tax=Streptomyces griseoaurantiacus M045 TaxID=996637 RepID=F3NH60_9ACTN|nr:hypothetical protein SGM_2474 [Streptomyces griseoaurantiacus M045]